MSGPINLSQLRSGHDLFLRKQDGWIQEAVVIAEEQAKLHVQRRSKFKRRKKTGSLKDATQAKNIKTANGRKLTLRWRNKYASFIEYGTPPHIIRPRRRAALRFVVRGQVVFARRVTHPGTRPYKFGWKATSAAHRVLTQRMDDRVRKARFRF